MSLFWRNSLLCGLFLTLTACEKPNPNPEMLDPIFQDLTSRLSAAESAITEAKGSLAEAKDNLEKALPQTGERKRAMEAIDRAQHQLVQAEQLKMYLEMRRAKRLKEDQKLYLEAYNAKKPWPSPKESLEYQQMRRLETASRTWDTRVPKSQGKRTPAAAPAAPAGHGESAEHE